jgi:hypothetical protein
MESRILAVSCAKIAFPQEALYGQRRWSPPWWSPEVFMDEDERSELVGDIFFVLTARLEDAAAIAVEGQVRALNNELLVKHANRIYSAG